MTAEDKIEIAKYMGAIKNGGSTIAKDGTWAEYWVVDIEGDYGYRTSMTFSDKETELGIWTPRRLRYDGNWNWIISVAKKVIQEIKQIQSEDLNVEIWALENAIVDIEKAILEFDIQKTCAAVLDGIKTIKLIREDEKK